MVARITDISSTSCASTNSLFLPCIFYYRFGVRYSEPIETIEQLANAVQQKGLVAPAIFTLELLKPLTGCFRELYGVSESLQALLFGRELLPALKALLSSSEEVERLIVLLEKPQGQGELAQV